MKARSTPWSRSSDGSKYQEVSERTGTAPKEYAKMKRGMTGFVSAQLGNKQEARDAFALFGRLGIQLTHDWTLTDDLSGGQRVSDEAARRAAADIQGVVDADIYVILTDNVICGKGMYAELGAALALHELRGFPEVCLIGKMRHMSIFYQHPAVRRFESLDQLEEHLGARIRANMAS